MGLMESGFGYYYPAGTPGPSTEHVIATCGECGWTGEGKLIRDLGTSDLVINHPGYQDDGACPDCGQDAPPLNIEEYDGYDPDRERDERYGY